jgi:arylsulfatase
MTPFRGEKNTNWEGAFRVPAMVRWPARIQPGQVKNDMMSHNDWFPTLLAAAGVPDIADQLKNSVELSGTTYKVHLDGQNQLPWLTGADEQSARNFFFYVSDDGDLLAVRYDNWKVVFLEQRVTGTMQIWAEPFTQLRVPKIFNLRTDPYERADVTSNTYWDWLLDHAYILVPMQAFVFEMIQSMIEFPARQEPASFSIEQVLEKMQAGIASS